VGLGREVGWRKVNGEWTRLRPSECLRRGRQGARIGGELTANPESFRGNWTPINANEGSMSPEAGGEFLEAGGFTSCLESSSAVSMPPQMLCQTRSKTGR